MEEFAQPSIRRHSDGYEDQETEIHGHEETIPWEAGRQNPGSGASRSRRDLLEAIMLPNATIARNFEPYVRQTCESLFS